MLAGYQGPAGSRAIDNQVPMEGPWLRFRYDESLLISSARGRDKVKISSNALQQESPFLCFVKVIGAVVERIVMDWFDENSVAKLLVFVLTLTRLPWLCQHLSILLLFAFLAAVVAGKLLSFSETLLHFILVLFIFSYFDLNKLRSHNSPISQYHIHFRVCTNIKYPNIILFGC